MARQKVHYHLAQHVASAVLVTGCGRRLGVATRCSSVWAKITCANCVRSAQKIRYANGTWWGRPPGGAWAKVPA